MMVAT